MEEDTETLGAEKMIILVKRAEEKHDIEIDVNATVQDLKEKVSKRFKLPLEQLCLNFAGKRLKDGDTMEQHGIKNGLLVHLDSVPDDTQQPQPAQPAAAPIVDLLASGAGQSNTPQPGLFSQMMENPFVKEMMSNPDIMRQLIMSNPQMREFKERNPQITHRLDNKVAVEQTMGLLQNPAKLRELMESQESAMKYLAGLDGGFNALQRMYKDTRRPMMNAAQDNASLLSSGSEAAVDKVSGVTMRTAVPHQSQVQVKSKSIRAPQKTDEEQQQAEQQLQELSLSNKLNVQVVHDTGEVTPEHEDGSSNVINEEEKEEEAQQLKTPIQEETQQTQTGTTSARQKKSGGGGTAAE